MAVAEHNVCLAKFHTVPPVEDLVLSILGQVIVILETAVDGLKELASTPVKDSLVDTATGVQFDVGKVVSEIVPLLKVCKFPLFSGSP